MEKKMTSGEIAKKVGVSQKAIRLYDEKGLLRPSGYSEGNYRLYDEDSLTMLNKIVALKKIGFSLEDIRDSLANGKAEDIRSALNLQLRAMEEKRYSIEMVIDTIQRTLSRKGDDLNWDDVSEIVKSVTLDQELDRSHWFAQLHTVPGTDWYETIYHSLDWKTNDKVLDLGCGFGKIWRNNRNRIPSGTEIFAYDVHGSWADDFEHYLEEEPLPDSVKLHLRFSDLEDPTTWKEIEANGPYSIVLAHYIYSELKEPEVFLERAAQALDKDGIFSINGPHDSSWDIYFRDVLSDAGIKAAFIQEKISAIRQKKDSFETMLNSFFPNTECVKLHSYFCYENEDMLFDKMTTLYEGQEKFFERYEEKIKRSLAAKLKESRNQIITESFFWHCSK